LASPAKPLPKEPEIPRPAPVSFVEEPLPTPSMSRPRREDAAVQTEDSTVQCYCCGNQLSLERLLNTPLQGGNLDLMLQIDTKRKELIKLLEDFGAYTMTPCMQPSTPRERTRTVPELASKSNNNPKVAEVDLESVEIPRPRVCSPSPAKKNKVFEGYEAKTIRGRNSPMANSISGLAMDSNSGRNFARTMPLAPLELNRLQPEASFKEFAKIGAKENTPKNVSPKPRGLRSSSFLKENNKPLIK
jgi:hypothetical protein